MHDICCVIDVERKMVKFYGEKTSVDKAREKVRDIFTGMKKKETNPEYIRKYHGRKGILQAMLKEDQKVPSHWTKNKGLWSNWIAKHMPSMGNVLVDVDAKTYAAIDQLVKGSWVQKFVGHGADSVGLSHSNIQVKKVQRIENPTTYRHYRTRVNLACEEGLKCDFPAITSINNEPEVLTAMLNIPEFERIRTREVNEYFLFHGTKENVKENIVVQGPDSRFSGKGLFGSGLYLSESATKADQYAGKHNTLIHDWFSQDDECNSVMLKKKSLVIGANIAPTYSRLTVSFG